MVDLADEAYLYCIVPENEEVGSIAVCEALKMSDSVSRVDLNSLVGSVTLDDTAWRNGIVFLGRYPSGSYNIRMFAPVEKDSDEIHGSPVDYKSIFG